MANPKRKWSKARTGARRSQWKLTVPGLSICPQCKEKMMPHRVCKSCGYYDGREIIKTEAK